MRKVFSLLMGVALAATFFNGYFSSHAKAVACKDINVVFLRGSSQNYTVPDGSDINFPEWKDIDGNIIFSDKRTNPSDPLESAFITKEAESAKYFEGIGNRILQEYPTLTMQFVSLHDFPGKYNEYGYRAIPAFGSLETAFISRNALDAKFGSSSIIGESTYGDYRNSIQDGAQELAGYLADEMVRCPSQYTVLGGFSQGAQVVGDAMALMHTRGQDNLLSRLGHVDLFGDPKFNGFKLDTSRLNPAQLHTTYPWVRGSANVNEVGSLGPREPYIPDILTAKTTSWCDFNDVVCGGYAGLSSIDLKSHAHVYKDNGGWVEKSAQETYIDMKPRLSLLAGVADKSANSPSAYWPGIKKPSKLDVMFVMDVTGDESLSLSPDSGYLGSNFRYLSDKYAPDGTLADTRYSSINAGIATYTELQRDDNIVSFPAVPVVMTDDIYSEFGAFQNLWASAHFLGNYNGGVDFQDSPYGALKLALDQQWRDDARHVIVLFSNSWGKTTEPVTNLTMKQITAKARGKNVEILPIFTSRTMRASPTHVNEIPAANAFYSAMAKQTKGHYAEVTDSLSRTLVYDVIMGHVFAPDVTIETGKAYTDPKTKKSTTTSLDNRKMIVKKDKKVVLSASKSSSPKSTIKKYTWDTNGDGIIDHESDDPYIEFSYDRDYDGQVCVTATDALGQSTTSCIDISTTNDDEEVTDAEPVILNAPAFHTTRSGSDLVITWPPTEGYIIFRDSDGALIVVVDGQSGLFTLRDVPAGTFNISGQLVNGANESEPVVLQVSAMENVEIVTPPASTGDGVVAPSNPNPPTGTGTPTGSSAGTPNSNGGSAAGSQVVLGATTISKDVLNSGLGATSDTKITLLPTNNSSPREVTNQAIIQSHEGIASTVQRTAVKAIDDLSRVVQDSLAWLVVLLLLLMWLYFRNRKRDEDTYQYDQQKRYASRKTVSLA